MEKLKLNKKIETAQLEELMRLCGYVYAYPNGTPYLNIGARVVYGTRFKNKESGEECRMFFDDKTLELLTSNCMEMSHLKYLLIVFDFIDAE